MFIFSWNVFLESGVYNFYYVFRGIYLKKKKVRMFLEWMSLDLFNIKVD